MEILFEDYTELAPNDYKEIVKNVIKETLNFENVNSNCEVSVTFVNNNEIKEINNKFRGKDMPTDVLSFPIINFEYGETIPSEGYYLLGDIIISLEKAKKQADDYGHSILREIGFLTAHSMLHLLGYDHMNKIEEEIMFKKQENILDNLNLTR